jgi:hypothetical protein
MDAVATFRSAVNDLQAGMEQQREARPEIAFDDQPPPRKLAPYAAAIGATVHESARLHDADGEIGWGSFVLLYDPAGQDGWGGPFRMIAYVRAELDPEIAADPLIGQVGWSWLTEALDSRTAGYAAPSGTVTRVVTEGFGAKHGEPAATGFELRASWSPAAADPDPDADPEGEAEGEADSTAGLAGLAESGELAGHLTAWCETLCAASGLPPLAAGVTPLRPAGSRRQT